MLGPWRGAASQAVYLTAGLVGLPVFAGGGGPHSLLKPSFGYLLGFVAGAWLAGRLAGSGPGLTFRRALAATYAGMAAIYAAGVLGLYLNLRYVAATRPGRPTPSSSAWRPCRRICWWGSWSPGWRSG